MKAEKTEKSMEPVLMVKGGGTKYKRRWRGPDGQYRYEYADPIQERKRTEKPKAKPRAKRLSKVQQGALLYFAGLGEMPKTAGVTTYQALDEAGLLDWDDNLRRVITPEGKKAAEALARKTKKSMGPTLVVKARGNTFMTHVPVAPQAGSAPRFHTPPIPDFQEIYCQPDDTAKQRKEREQGETRRRAEAERNRGKYGMHGSPIGLKPVLRWGETDMGASSVAIHEPERVTKRTPRKSPKLVARQQVESAAKPNEDKLDKKKSKRKKKKKQAKLVARVK